MLGTDHLIVSQPTRYFPDSWWALLCLQHLLFFLCLTVNLSDIYYSELRFQAITCCWEGVQEMSSLKDIIPRLKF